jgi:DNA polymerase III delta prime subunit
MAFDDLMNEHVWVQKYRPQSLDEIVLPKHIIDPIKQYVREKGKIPHLLFTSILPGSGKSSLANSIINELGAEYLKINASSDNGIAVVRDQIEPFATRSSLFGSSNKIIWLDEADRTSAAMQDGLRGVMEEYSSEVSFILTGNNKNGISEPVQDRCEIHDFNLDNADIKKEIIIKIIKRVKFILDSEGVTYDMDILMKFVDKNYPRFRNIISTIQKYVTGNGMILDAGILRTTTIDESFYDLILAGNFTSAKEFILKNGIQADPVYTDLYKHCLPKITDKSVYAPFLITLNRYQVQNSQVMDKELNLVAGLLELCALCKNKK